MQSVAPVLIHDISSRRHAVSAALVSAATCVKRHTTCPENGLAIFCGEVVDSAGHPVKVQEAFQPLTPVPYKQYLCDSHFHTEALLKSMEASEQYGFVVMDGSGFLLGRVCGSRREVLHRTRVQLPNKHRKGGQSAPRFGRLRDEARNQYVRKVAETMAATFVTNDKPNVAGLVLAGSAEFKNQLQTSDLFDPRLAAVVVAVVDVSYGGENGFNQAIELASDSLANVKFVAEKKLVGKFFDEIAKDTGCYAFGVRDIMHALDMSAVETLIVYEDLPESRLELRNPATGEITVQYLRPEQEKERHYFEDKETGQDLEIADRMPMVEWLAQNYKSFGAKLEFVTDRSQEGSQFVKGFGGIGGLLRWKVDFMELNEQLEGGLGFEDEDDFM